MDRCIALVRGTARPPTGANNKSACPLLLLLNDGQQVHFVTAPDCRSHVQSLSTPLRCLQVLRVGKGDMCLTLTSGGCNAINMCLQGASSVTAVDCNPAQSALLDLKAAAIRCRSWDIP